MFNGINITVERGANTGVGVLGSLTLTLSVITVFGGITFLLSLCQRRRKNLTTVLYLLLLSGNLATSISGFFIVYELLKQHGRVDSKDTDVVTYVSRFTSQMRLLNAMLFGISIRFSASMTFALCTMRTYMLLRPRGFIRTRVVYSWLILLNQILVLSVVIPFIAGQYECPEFAFTCQPILPDPTWTLVVLVAFPFCFVNVVVFVCCLVIIHTQCRFAATCQDTAGRDTSNRNTIGPDTKSCTAVFFISMAYVLTNTTTTVQSFIRYLSRETVSDGTHSLTADYCLSILPHFIFCTLTIVVFLGRSLSFFNTTTLQRTVQARVSFHIDKMREHVTSNLAVQQTARSVRWDRRSMVGKVGPCRVSRVSWVSSLGTVPEEQSVTTLAGDFPDTMCL